MSTTDTERYLRITLLTFEGGTWISKEILSREVNNAPGPTTLDTLLLGKKVQLTQKRICGKITERQYESLFPISGADTDTNDWDLSLLIKIVLFLFKPSLPRQECQDLRDILRIRNEVVCHAKQPSVNEREFTRHFTALTSSIRGLAFDARTNKYASDLLRKLSEDPLDLRSSIEKVAQLCRNDEHMENIFECLTRFDRRLNHIAEGVDNTNMILTEVATGVNNANTTLNEGFGNVNTKLAELLTKVSVLESQRNQEANEFRVEIPVLKGKVCISGVDQSEVELAENIVLKVTNNAINKVDDRTDNEKIKTAIHQNLENLKSHGGQTEAADSGSIILTIRCKTYVDLYNFLNLFNNDGQTYRLVGIESALNELLQNEVNVELMLPEDTIDMLRRWIEDGLQEYKRDINLSIRCDSAAAALDVIKYLQSSESAKSMNQIAEAVSEVIDGDIKIEAMPDVEGFSQALRPAMSEQRELSLRLNAVLEMVGVTEEMRRYYQRMATMREILDMVRMKRCTGELVNVFLCGSSWEGTVTPSLVSDVDVIHCPSKLLVVPRHGIAEPGLFLNVVREKWTRPGYVKLQYVMDGRPLTVHDVAASDTVGFDEEGRACVKNVTTGTMHGPAKMDLDGIHFADIVFAFQCKGIPLFTTNWISRHRQYDWPSQQLIDELKMMGCLFVGVGYYESPDRDLEWRVTFSLQERMLVKSLNIVQHRVYVILKMIKRDILMKSLCEESFTSYHCKTCVFYMAETTPASMWVPENIINCLLRCLSLILRWIRNGFCPSFFLNDVNLFKKGFHRLAEPLEKLIASLLQTGPQFLYLLHSDSVGKMLTGGDLVLYKLVADSRLDKYILDKNLLTINHIIEIFRHLKVPCKSAKDSLALYLTELEAFQHGDETFPNYTDEEYKDVLRLALPWLHLSIGLEFAVRAVTCQGEHESKVLNSKVDYYLQKARDTDLVNVRLAQATILLRLEKLEECFLLLQELENCWHYRVVIYCPCSQSCSLVYMDNKQYCEMAAECRRMSIRKLMRTRYASCVIFELSQIELVPHPLPYEMYRSLYTQPGSRDTIKDAWFDRAVVDAKVYLYLLQYLVCSKLNREFHKRIAIDNLASITLRDKGEVLSHRETAFNLLGWVYLQEHRDADAVWCFFQSWRIRPDHNAAKFYLLFESYRMAEARTHVEIKQVPTMSHSLPHSDPQCRSTISQPSDGELSGGNIFAIDDSVSDASTDEAVVDHGCQELVPVLQIGDRSNQDTGKHIHKVTEVVTNTLLFVFGKQTYNKILDLFVLKK